MSIASAERQRTKHLYAYKQRAEAVTDQLVAIASKFDSTNRKKGGYLSLNAHRVTFISSSKIGEVPAEKDEKYRSLASEKAFRVIHSGADSSWATRNPEKDLWGGAIRGRKFIYGFSGFPELWDEAIVLELAVILRDLSVRKAREIAATSGNGYFALLHSAFGNFISAA